MPYTEEEKKARQLEAVRKYRREKYVQFRTLADAASKKYRAARQERINAYQRERHRQNPKTMMLAKAKQRARLAGVPFSLAPGDFIIPDFCPLLGIPIVVGAGFLVSGSPSIDRIIPELGYVFGNVWVISHRANALKNNFTLEQMEHFARVIRAKLIDVRR